MEEGGGVGKREVNMKRQCKKCGAEYTLGHLSFDSGLCLKCKPGFFSAPIWLQPIPAGTKDLWRTVIVLHMVMFILSGMILDCGEISIPSMIYCLTMLIYFAFRFVLARFKGYPILSKFQAVGLLLLPLYGPVLFIYVFYLGQKIRYGSWAGW